MKCTVCKTSWIVLVKKKKNRIMGHPQTYQCVRFFGKKKYESQRESFQEETKF